MGAALTLSLLAGWRVGVPDAGAMRPPPTKGSPAEEEVWQLTMRLAELTTLRALVQDYLDAWSPRWRLPAAHRAATTSLRESLRVYVEREGMRPDWYGSLVRESLDGAFDALNQQHSPEDDRLAVAQIEGALRVLHHALRYARWTLRHNGGGGSVGAESLHDMYRSQILHITHRTDLIRFLDQLILNDRMPVATSPFPLTESEYTHLKHLAHLLKVYLPPQSYPVRQLRYHPTMFYLFGFDAPLSTEEERVLYESPRLKSEYRKFLQHHHPDKQEYPPEVSAMWTTLALTIWQIFEHRHERLGTQLEVRGHDVYLTRTMEQMLLPTERGVGAAVLALECQ